MFQREAGMAFPDPWVPDVEMTRNLSYFFLGLSQHGACVRQWTLIETDL